MANSFLLRYLIFSELGSRLWHAGIYKLQSMHRWSVIKNVFPQTHQYHSYHVFLYPLHFVRKHVDCIFIGNAKLLLLPSSGNEVKYYNVKLQVTSVISEHCVSVLKLFDGIAWLFINLLQMNMQKMPEGTIYLLTMEKSFSRFILVFTYGDRFC